VYGSALSVKFNVSLHLCEAWRSRTLQRFFGTSNKGVKQGLGDAQSDDVAFRACGPKKRRGPNMHLCLWCAHSAYLSGTSYSKARATASGGLVCN
jgi:hypothetical protein